MKKNKAKKTRELRDRRNAPLATRTDLSPSATKDIAGSMNAILADVFALYLKTKNFHWHMSGPHFRDYHLLLDEHAEQLFAMTDPIAERIRKVGGPTIKSIGHISRIQRVVDNDAEYVEPPDMLAELAEDNKTMAARLREAHDVCDEHRERELDRGLDRRNRTPTYHRLAAYLFRYTKERVALVMGVPSLKEIFDEKYYLDLEGGILESFGRLFKNDLKLYVYPSRPSRDQPLITAENLEVAPHLRDLYSYLLKNRSIQSVRGYREEYLPIFSRDVLTKLRAGDAAWEKMVPTPVARMIKQRKLFGYHRVPGKRVAGIARKLPG